MMDRKEGAWATDLFEYGRVYNIDFDLNKEERVRFADSAMNHAMAFAGVDVAAGTSGNASGDAEASVEASVEAGAAAEGTTKRWRVENSWGTDIADKGYFTMSDDWFDEFVYEVAVPKSMLPAEYQAALEEEPIMLPAWDPMGALA